MGANTLRRLAARVLGVGESRVWFDPSKKEEIEKAVTKADVRRLVLKGYVRALPERRRVRERERRRRGPGKKKGSKYVRVSRKERWINTVRPLREMLRELKEEGMLDGRTYRKLYRLVKGGMFRSRAHLRIYLEQHNLLKGERA